MGKKLKMYKKDRHTPLNVSLLPKCVRFFYKTVGIGKLTTSACTVTPELN